MTHTLQWLRSQSEESLVRLTLIFTGCLCLLLLFWPKPSISEPEHDEHEGGEHQGVVEIKDEVLKTSEMSLELATAKTLTPGIKVRGQIVENSQHSMNVKPRFSGIVRSVHKDFGDIVRKGDVLAVIESASTRSSYTIKSATDGVIADKRVVVGAFAPQDESIFRVVNLDSVWFQGSIPSDSSNQIKAGLKAIVKDRILGVEFTGNVIYISPVIDDDTQASAVRIQIENKDSRWMVGSFAEATILAAPAQVKVAIKSEAIQNIDGQWIVFKKQDAGLFASAVIVGKSDGAYTEILSGLEAGDKYVSSNSFLAKAELLKSTAEHED